MLSRNVNTETQRATTDEGCGPLVPSSSQWSKALEPQYWDKRYASRELVWTGDANRFLVEETEGLPPGTALDLASGEGRNAVWLAERGWSVRAVDFSKVATEKAVQMATSRGVDERIDFQTADLRSFNPGAQCFDLVVLVYLQVPQVELVPILERAARAVAPGGTLLLVAHDSDNLLRGFGGPQHPDMLYSAAQVVAALGNELTIEKASQVSRIVDTKDGIQMAIDCLVRAKRN
jgi:SAM-dependent methyltransferase